MKSIMSACLQFRRSILLLFLFLVVSGLITYITIPRESDPDVQIPVAVVSFLYRGVTPEDGDRLIIRPAEQHLQSIEGVKKIHSTSYQGACTILIEFDTKMDIDRALTLIRNKMSQIRSEIPNDVEEPQIEEINVSLFPVLTVELAGNVPQRFLFKGAEHLKDRLESIDKVLEAKVIGSRDEILQVDINPLMLQKYKIVLQDIKNLFLKNNAISLTGKIKTGDAWFYLKSPTLIKAYQEISNFPIKTNGKSVVRLGDIATVRKTFKWAHTFSESNGERSVALDVKKRIGRNIIQTIDAAKEVANQFVLETKGQIKAKFSNDQSERISDMLSELQNNIILSIILVMAVMIFSLGWRSSLIVGIAIPTSFLGAIFFLGLMGLTLNVVVLFSLILSVGMLVDGAIIIVEYADRKMAEGKSKLTAYHEAAIKMAWPVISSIATHTVVFLPLLFWPGIVGKFMRFLPITLIFTLGMSLVVALMLIPVLGSIFGRLNTKDKKKIDAVALVETGSLDNVSGASGLYIKMLFPFLKRPFLSLLGISTVIFSIFFLYTKINKGIEFFPQIDPSTGVYSVRVPGNRTAESKLKIMKELEAIVRTKQDIKSIYLTAGIIDWNDTDIIGRLYVELKDWKVRGKGIEILEAYLEELKQLPGISVELDVRKSGPSQGKPIQISVKSMNQASVPDAVQFLVDKLKDINGTRDVDDTRPRPGIEWVVEIDRVKAAQMQTNPLEVNQLMQMLGEGVMVGTYQPVDNKSSVDIMLSFPEAFQDIHNLQGLKLSTPGGNVSLKSLLQINPRPKFDRIERIDGKYARTITAQVDQGIMPNDVISQLKNEILKNQSLKDVDISFEGDQEDQDESKQFLFKAFLTAIFIILIILVTQFNSFFSAFLVLSAVIMATAGGLIGLLVMGQPFSVVMGGIGMIALAGVIVSNNIIFIDTYDSLKSMNEAPLNRILRTGALRLRPIFLTQITGILGLMPILLRLDIDFIGGSLHQGAPSSEMWVQLATIMTFGLGFGSIITLIFTPCALMAKEKFMKDRDKISKES